MFPNTASGALVVVGSAFRNTIAPVARLGGCPARDRNPARGRALDP